MRLWRAGTCRGVPTLASCRSLKSADEDDRREEDRVMLVPRGAVLPTGASPSRPKAGRLLARMRAATPTSDHRSHSGSQPWRRQDFRPAKKGSPDAFTWIFGVHTLSAWRRRGPRPGCHRDGGLEQKPLSRKPLALENQWCQPSCDSSGCLAATRPP